MFELTKTFTHTTGFRITPIAMEGVGFIFLPKELEDQLGYDNLSNTVRQNESFAEGIEYLVLRNSKLFELKELLSRRNSIASACVKYANALIVLTEPGLYTTMILSRKPNAQAFRRWVTCEVLPSILKTGMYSMPAAVVGTFEALPELVQRVSSLEQTIAQLFVKQRQFQQYTLQGLDRIEAVLAESLPHDMFEGWKKIKGLVDDMTKLYGLSELERRRYLRELCQTHDIHLPEKALLESESLFHDAQGIAIKAGVYSAGNRPHSRVIVALIRHLGLDHDQYCQKFPMVRRGYRTTVLKYSDNVVPHLLEWLKANAYPETIELPCGAEGEIRKFRVKYRFRA